MNIFVPVMCHTSPSRSARVRIAATSEPASGSVIAIAPIFSPAIAGRSHRSRCVVGAELRECGRRHVGLHRDRHRDRGGAGAREFFDEDDAGGQVPVSTAPLGGIVQAEEAEFAAAPEEIVGESPGRLPFVDVRPDLGLDEPAHRRPERVVLGAEDRMRRGHGKNAATSLIRS